MSTLRIGVFGGTFDPPHIAHLVVADDVRVALSLDLMVMVVAGEPWQKTTDRSVSPASVRLAMTAAAIENMPGFEVSDIEIRRRGPSYTVDTLAEIGTQHPSAELYLVLGADAAVGLGTWERSDELDSMCSIVVVDRPGTVAPVAHRFEVRRVEAPRLDISSTQLRDRAARGLTLRHLVPDAVISVIEGRGLYCERP